MPRFFKSLFLFVISFSFIIFTFWRFKTGVDKKNLEQLNKKKFVSNFERLNKDRNFIESAIFRILPEPEASLANGILLGTKANFPKETYEAMRRAGILHVIALSGQNISILISAICMLLIPFLGRRKAAFASILTIIIFIWFVGPSSSVVRAGIMGTMAMLSIIIGREYWGVLSLFLTGLIMIVIDPVSLTDIGFQLSFMASLGIMLIGGGSELRLEMRVEKKLGVAGSANLGKDKQDCSNLPIDAAHQALQTWQGQKNNDMPGKTESNGKKGKYFWLKEVFRDLIRGVITNLRITLAAQVFTMPILLSNFGQISIISPLVNVLVVWMVPMIMFGTAIAALLTLIRFEMGFVFGFVIYVPLLFFISIVNFFGSLFFAAVDLPKISLSASLVYYGLLFLVMGFTSLRTSKSH